MNIFIVFKFSIVEKGKPLIENKGHHYIIHMIIKNKYHIHSGNFPLILIVFQKYFLFRMC